MNRVQKLYNRARRSVKRVPETRIKELREQCSREWMDRNDVVGVGRNEKGVVVFCDEALRGNVDMEAFDAYIESPLQIIYTEPFSGSQWGDPPMNAMVEERPQEYVQSTMAEGEVPVPLFEPFVGYVSRTAKIRPCYGGPSVGNEHSTAGTLTMMVQDKGTGEKLALSNAHVFAMDSEANMRPVGDKILQPGPVDIANNGITGDCTIGYLERYINLEDGCNVDCAVAKLTSPDIGRYGMLGIGDVWFTADPEMSMNLEKTGRTTGISTYEGLTAIDVEVKMNYGTKVVVVKDCFISMLKSAGGDSGSPICERYTAKLIGLLFGGNGTYTIGCKATEVFRQLNIELLPCPYGKALDVSHYNGEISREAIRTMKERGVQFLMIKFSDGASFKDDQARNTAMNCDLEQMPWLPYHFNRASVSWSTQLNNLIAAIGDLVPWLQPMLDNETADGCNPDKITSVSLRLLKEIWNSFSAYLAPIYYSRRSWHDFYCLESSEWEQFALHCAHWYTDIGSVLIPRDWKAVGAKLWQMSADKNYLGAYFGLLCKHVDVNLILDPQWLQDSLTKTPQEPEEPEEPDEPDDPEEPDEPVEGDLKTGTHYFGKTTVYLKIRSGPSTSYTKVAVIPVNKDVRWFEEVEENGNIWICIGWNQYCAAFYKGETFVKYVKES